MTAPLAAAVIVAALVTFAALLVWQPCHPPDPAAAQQAHRPAGDRREPGSDPETRARLAHHNQENRPSADTRCKAALSPTEGIIS